MQDPHSQISAWNTQAIEDVRDWMKSIDSKLDKHIAEGAEVKANIAVLTSQSVDPSRVAVLEARVGRPDAAGVGCRWCGRSSTGSGGAQVFGRVIQCL